MNKNNDTLKWNKYKNNKKKYSLKYKCDKSLWESGDKQYTLILSNEMLLEYFSEIY